MKVELGQTKAGVAGSARELLITLGPDDKKDWAATIGCWFIYAPGQPPAWRHYGLSVCHLRDLEGVKPAHIRIPGATHEFMLLALDPHKNPEADRPESWVRLFPMNLMEQVKLPNDATASRLLDMAATEVVEGRLWAEAPLSGQTEPWRSWLRHQASVLK